MNQDFFNLKQQSEYDRGWKHGYKFGAWSEVERELTLNAPFELQTKNEKTAYAFGWFKALEYVRKNTTVHVNEFKCPYCYDEPDNLREKNK